jgi:sialate O-acetylesterase
MRSCLKMTGFLRSLLVKIWLIVPSTLLAASEVRPLLHPFFSDHAMLQRDRPATIWGWADPGTKVTVRFAGQTKHASAGADGKWACSLDPLAASGEGRRLEVETDKPKLAVAVDDVLVGDVWLCSGQSNMEMGITLCKEDQETADGKHPGIRLLTIPQKASFKPKETFAAEWKPCSPQTLREDGWGGFSATAYFFGKRLHRELGIPIGLIHSSWGGTVAEA